MTNRVTIGDFRKKVLDEKGKIDERTFLTSKGCADYLQNMAEAITRKYDSSINIMLDWKKNGAVAWTNSRSELYLNPCNKYVERQADMAMKLVMLKALVLHECGHMLFTNFHTINANKKVFIDNRKLFPSPDNSAAYNEWLTDAVVMKDLELKEWFKIWHKIQNIVEDGFIEGQILKMVPGDGQCLLKLRELDKSSFQTVKEMRSSGLSTPSIVFNLLLELALYGTIKMDQDDKEDVAIKELLNNYSLIKKATSNCNAFDRVKDINEIFCRFYKFFKEEHEKEENNDSKKKSTSNDDREDSETGDSEEQSTHDDDGDNSEAEDSEEQSILDDDEDDDEAEDPDINQNDNSQILSELAQNNSSTEDQEDSSTGDSSSTESSSDSSSRPDPSSIQSNYSGGIQDNLDLDTGSVMTDAESYSGNSEDDTTSPSSVEEMMEDMAESETDIDADIPSPDDIRKTDSITEQIAEEKVKDRAEKDLAKQLQEDANDMNQSRQNRNAKITINRKSVLYKQDYLSYEEDYAVIALEVKKLVREIKNKIKDQQAGGKVNGLYQGRYLDTHSLYRYDQRILCKNDLPEDIPDMAIAIIIDASGSMNGEKIRVARQTALMMYLFAQELNIPCLVYAHDSYGSNIRLQALADFDSVDSKDKYRICGISSGWSNRDGVAIRFVSERLSKKPQQTKLCFVISDGLPSDYNSIADAYDDIRDTLAEFGKKGVKYITCGLGEDAARIKKIYLQNNGRGVEFLDCSTPSQLPVNIVRTIKTLIK